MATSPDNKLVKKRKRDVDANVDECEDSSVSVAKALKREDNTTASSSSCAQLLKDLPSAIVQHSIFPFLSTNQLTLFASVSHTAAALVEDFRQHPCIFQQQLLPLKMSFINFQRGMRRLPGEPFDVHIAQTVRFLLHTASREIVQLEFCLTEYLWTELNGTRRYRGLTNEDRCVWVEVKIFRKVFQRNAWRLERIYESTPPPQHPRTGATCASYFLEGYDDNPSDTALYFFRRQEFERRQEELDTLEVPENIQDKQRACVEYVWVCANRLASSPSKYNFPNLHYIILSALPKDLYKYLPTSFQPDATKAVGPKLFPRWKPRFPQNPQEWHSFLWQGNNEHDMYGQLKKDFLIYDIPWYRSWYPKPIVLNPTNILNSLPTAIMIDRVLPYLEDLASLQEVLPDLEAHCTRRNAEPK